MSYRSKRIIALLAAASLAAAGLSGCASSDGSANVESSADTESGTENASYETLSYEDMFTDRDFEVGYDESEAVTIDLENLSAADGVSVDGSVITITREGTYIITGTLTEGQIIVDAEDAKVQLVLDNADITCASSAAIYVKSADKTFITLAEGSENTLTNTQKYVAVDENNIDAVIFSKDDLTLNGNGSLTINAANGHGIVSKDDLKITGGTYTITAASHALSGKDSVRIADGTFTLTSGKDGIHAENTDDTEEGFVYIAGGSFTITADGDGIDASNIVQVDDGEINITAAGGAANSTKQHESDMPGGNMGEAMPSQTPDGEAPELPDGTDGEAPQKPDRTDGEVPQQPDGTEDSDDTASTKGIKADGAIFLLGGTFTIDAADDAIHSNADIQIEDGTFTLSSGDDGVHSDDALIINGGNITVSESYEGLEGLTVTVNDGTIDITASDDGINAAGGADASGFGGMGGDSFGGFPGASAEDGAGGAAPGTTDGANTDTADENETSTDETNADAADVNETSTDEGNADEANTDTADTEEIASSDEMWMEINGGTIHVLAGGDGLDSNGDLIINGGEIYIDGPSDGGNSAIDYGDGCTGYVNGGTLVAVGGSTMAEEMSTDSEQAVMFVKLDSQQEAGEVTVTDADGNIVISYTTQKAYDCVIISTDVLEEGQTYTLTASGTETEVELQGAS